VIGAAWMAESACKGIGPAPFFPVGTAAKFRTFAADHYAAARAICNACPVRDACLEFALGLEDQHIPNDGMWGGLDEGERRKITHRRREAVRRAS